MAFGSGVRPWARGTLAKIAASSSTLASGELLVDEAGGIYGGDGVKTIKQLSPALTQTGALAGFLAQAILGPVAPVVTGDTSAAVRAANTAALVAACQAAVAGKQHRVYLPPGVIHFGTTGAASGIAIPQGLNGVQLVGTTLGPQNDGFQGSTLSYWGTGAAIDLGQDDGGAYDANTYDGVEGFGLTNVAVIYGGTTTTALLNGKGNYGTGTYGIRDWRGGRLNLHRAYIAGFEWGVWGIQSDENSVYEGKIKRCHIGWYLGPRSDQFLMQSLEAYYCDIALDIDGVAQPRFHACQFVNCGSATTPSIRLRSSTSRPNVGTIFESCWFEMLLGASCPAFIDVGVGDTVTALDVQVLNPYVSTNSTASGLPHAASLVRVGNASRTLIADPAMQYNGMFDQLVEFVGALPASPDLTIRGPDQQQFNTTTSGTQTPAVHWDLRTAAGAKGMGGPLAFYSLTAAKRRWQLGLANTETGTNSGSDLQLTSYNDDGTQLANLLTIARSSAAFIFPNGVNIATGTGTGTKIGTTATQKVGFFGRTPVTQRAAIASPTADVTALKTSVDLLRQALVDLGLTAP